MFPTFASTIFYVAAGEREGREAAHQGYEGRFIQRDIDWVYAEELGGAQQLVSGRRAAKTSSSCTWTKPRCQLIPSRNGSHPSDRRTTKNIPRLETLTLR